MHLGGTLDEIAAGEAAVWRGEHPDRPFVGLAQPSRSILEPCAGGTARCAGPIAMYRRSPRSDMTDRIEAQVERLRPASAI